MNVAGFNQPNAPTNFKGRSGDGQITNWMRHGEYDCCYLSGCEGIPDLTRFWCDKCRAWRKMRNASGNVRRHWESVHTDTKRDKVISKRDMLTLIIEQDLPFAVTESANLRRMTGICVTRQAMSDFAQTARGEVMVKLINLLSKCETIVLTFDEWADKNLVKYLGVKVLTLSDANIYKVYSLSHFPIEENPDALNLSRIIDKILKSYNIRDATQLVYAVTDTTAVMPRTVTNLRLTHLPCWCHVLNLMLTDILEEFKGEGQNDKPLDPLFTAVGSVKKSQKFRQLLRDANYQSIPTYCPCRWYSLWKLLRNAIGVQDELNQFLSKKKHAVISEGTWALAANLLDVVSTFRNCTEKLESDSFGSISYVLLVRHMLTLITNEHRSCTEIADGWRNALQRHWNRWFSGLPREIVIMAAFLNPAVNLDLLMTADEHADAIKVVEKRLKELKKAGSPGSSQKSESRTDRMPRSPERGITVDDIKPRQEGQYDEMGSFITARRNASINSGTDLLDWWRVNRDLFPMLWKLAMEVLTIPASSAASERQFSRAKRISSDKRRSLKPNKLQALVFLAENFDLTQEVLRSEKYD
jgi:hypothetical protein